MLKLFMMISGWPARVTLRLPAPRDESPLRYDTLKHGTSGQKAMPAPPKRRTSPTLLRWVPIRIR